jgi:hemerythrin
MTLSWNEATYGCGDSGIDRQHRWLFERINSLIRAYSQDHLSDEADELLDFLHVYFLEHFTKEEALMASSHCLAKEQNQREHQAFILRFEALKERILEEGATRELIKEFQDDLVHWFEHHVKVVDIQLRTSLAAMNS